MRIGRGEKLWDQRAQPGTEHDDGWAALFQHMWDDDG